MSKKAKPGKKAKLLNKYEMKNYKVVAGPFRRLKLDHYLCTLQEQFQIFHLPLEPLALWVARYYATTLFFYGLQIPFEKIY